jgi:hypothetical protein
MGGVLFSNIVQKLSEQIRDLVLKAVTKSGGELEYASEELQNDEEIVLEALLRSLEALLNMPIVHLVIE